MFKKTLTAAVAALTLTSATLTPTSSAQAGSLGKVVAIGILGAAVGAIASAAGSRSAQAEENGYRSHGRFDDRPDYRSGGYRPVRGGHEGGCGFRKSPVFDEYGNRIGSRNVPAC